MIDLLHDLVRHKAYANAALLKAIRRHEPAVQDPELQKLLHHIILADRFWFFLSIGRPFSRDEESIAPESFEAMAALYRETHTEELEWWSRLQGSDLARSLETHFIPGHQYSIAQATMQVCMHSNAHRAQCATRLRFLGGTPPAMDFVLWLKERPAPEWL